MTCEDYRDAIVEVARGGSESVEAHGLSEHLARCAACARRLEQQRALTVGLRALAATTRAEAAGADLEERLLALSACAAEGRSGSAAQENTRRRMTWLPAAAAIALLAGGSLAWWQIAERHRDRQPTPLVSARTAPATATPGVSDKGARPVPGGTPATRSVAASDRPSGRNAQVPGARTAARRRASGSRPAAPEVVVAEGFVAVPWAATLPDFDGGEIVRTEIPVTTLPFYGISVSPDAATRPIQADLLVGQDGRPRAIRLVAYASTGKH